MKKILYLMVIFCAIYSCSKEEEDSNGNNFNGVGSGGTTTSCSTISAANTITHNGVNYHINAFSVSQSAIGIEVVNTTGTFTTSYSAGLLQLNNSGQCYQTSSSTEGAPGAGKYFEYHSLPTWTTNNATKTKFKITLDGSTYALQDLNFNQN